MYRKSNIGLLQRWPLYRGGLLNERQLSEVSLMTPIMHARILVTHRSIAVLHMLWPVLAAMRHWYA